MGGARSLRKEKARLTPRAQRRPSPVPRRALRPSGPEGGPRPWRSVKSTESASVARPGRVAPRASAGRLALGDLSREAAGLAAENEGGLRGPRAPDTPAPVARGETPTPPREAAGPHPHPPWPPSPPAPPRGAGALHPGPGRPPRPLCRWPPLQGFRTAGRGHVRYPVPSVQPSPREIPHPTPAKAKKVWAAHGSGPAAPGEPGRPRPCWPRGRNVRGSSLGHELWFIQQLLTPGQHRSGPAAGSGAHGPGHSIHCPQPLGLGEPPSPQTPLQPGLHHSLRSSAITLLA